MKAAPLVALVRPSIVLLALFTALTGVVYPAVVTWVGQTAFPGPANGSLVDVDGRIVGSRLVGQAFDDPRYFRGRPSATSPLPYDAASSAGSNLGPTNPALLAEVGRRVASVRASDGAGAPAGVPVDLVTASASGLDPHLSPAAALRQVPAVAKARGMPEQIVRDLVLSRVEERTLGVLGERRVNVLLLNLALDALARPAAAAY